MQYLKDYGQRVEGTKYESLAFLVSDGGFREGFLKVMTAEIRLINTDEPPRESGQGEIRSLPEGQSHEIEGISHWPWRALTILGCLWKPLTILNVFFSPIN